ncbi:15646_t:CDS:2 [Entrophospora sp. SA101]|nr:15646_t:CDS:2 [Entrophospora sp. SA101]
MPDFLHPMVRTQSDCKIVKNNDLTNNYLVNDTANTIQVQFSCGVSNETICNNAKLGFDRAVKIFPTFLVLKAPIILKAVFGDLCPTCSAGPSRFIPLNDTDNITRLYPQALVKQLNLPEAPEFLSVDIIAGFSTRANFWFEGDPPIGATQVDFVLVVMHEIIHGLGLVHTWRDHFSLSALSPIPVVINNTQSFKLLGFVETVFDKNMILLQQGSPTNVTSMSNLTVELNKFSGINKTYPSYLEFVTEWTNSSQYQITKDIFTAATTPQDVAFLSHTNTQIMLETAIPYTPGSTLGHLSAISFNKTADLIMLWRAIRGATVESLSQFNGGYQGGPIGPNIKLLLETLGYTLQEGTLSQSTVTDKPQTVPNNTDISNISISALPAPQGPSVTPVPTKSKAADAKTTPAPKVVQPKVDPPKANPPKADKPNVEPPKTDQPKTDQPKADQPKADQPNTTTTDAKKAPEATPSNGATATTPLQPLPTTNPADDQLIANSMFTINYNCDLADKVVCGKVERSIKKAGGILTKNLALVSKINVAASFKSICKGCDQYGKGTVASTVELVDDDGMKRLYPSAVIKQFNCAKAPAGGDDILLDINSGLGADKFHFDDDAKTIEAGQQDLTALALRELAHGLGLRTSWNIQPELAKTKTLTPKLLLKNAGKGVEFLGFEENAYDKNFYVQGEGKFLKDYVKELNKFSGGPGAKFANQGEFVAKFVASDQGNMAQTLAKLATTPNSISFLPKDAQKTDAIILDTQSNPFNPGFSLDFFDKATYAKTSDFLMTEVLGSTLDQLTVDGKAVGPKLRALLSTMGGNQESIQTTSTVVKQVTKTIPVVITRTTTNDNNVEEVSTETSTKEDVQIVTAVEVVTVPKTESKDVNNPNNQDEDEFGSGSNISLNKGFMIIFTIISLAMGNYIIFI